ncbi:PAS domain-containing protein [uncultured Thiocystis sp.]|jgi:PAS domain S-box-containing protein|uniref:PAS domain-containing protein n=1 Tax=uncultured Thiocystis sp. TaxID=1202134 RepID=UPI0025E48EE9|nr:PAS domain-containing protein [uncultured Thiocystis sp.]
MTSATSPAAPLPDLHQCDAEPIHVPGSIQPHGALLALHGPGLRITQVSASCQDLLGIATSDLLEHDLADVLGDSLADGVHLALHRYRERPLTLAAFDWRPATGKQGFTGYVHPSGAATILELEPVPAASPALGQALVQAVRESDLVHLQTALPAKLQTAATLFQRLTGYDRVMIYRFHPDWHGEVVAEARGEGLKPYLGLHFPASDIPVQARALYLTSPTRVIVDIDYTASPLLPAQNPVGGPPLDLSLSLLRSVSPVHLEYLRNMGVCASLTASLLCDGQLWGLIACHHLTPLQVSGEIRELAGWIARNLADQIALLETRERQRHATQLKHCRDHIIGVLRQGRRLSELLQGAERESLLNALGAGGVALIHGAEVATAGVTPAPSRILDLVARLSALHADSPSRLFATDCLSAHLEDAADLTATAAGVVLFPLDATKAIQLMWFRDEQLRHVDWGGNPDKAMDRAPDGRLSPRRSFAAWSQLVRAHSRPWSPEELDSARELAALIDIESQQVAEEARKAQEILLKDVLDSLTAHIAVLDRRGAITLINANWRRFAEQNGGDDACLVGANYLTICNRVVSGQDGLEAQAALRGIQQVIARAKGAFTLTYPCDSPTEPRWFEMRVLPLSGPQPGALIAHEEITARMLAQLALQASEQQLQWVLEAANDGFWDWDMIGGEVLFSDRWAEMLGYAPGEIEPTVQGWAQRMHPDDLPRCETALQAHLFGETARYECEHRLLTRDGEWRWMLGRSKIIARDAQGQPLRMVGTITDITDRRRAEEALRTSLDEVSRHDAQMIALNEMNDLLLSCLTNEDAYPIIARSAQTLFADFAGGLAVIDDSGALRRVAAWGHPDSLPPAFALNDCWALRRGQPHAVTPDNDEIACRHFPAEPPLASLCIPLNVRGATLGLLHLSASEALTPARLQDLRRLAATVSESIKLALSNLRLQESLQHPSPTAAIRDA